MDLGIQARTGEPKGSSGFIISELNNVGLTGRFPRIFENVQLLRGTLDREFIIGTPQASKNDWYIVDDAIKNARNTPITFHLYSYHPLDSVQANITVLDRGGVNNSMTLRAAYKNNNSHGVWDNDTCVQFKTGVKFTLQIAEDALADATTYILNSVVGLSLGDIIRIGVNSMKILTINENTNTVTVLLDGTTPAFLIGDTVEVIGFKIITYRRQPNGLVLKVDTNFNDRWLSMEPENISDYFVNVLEQHPLFNAEDENSVSLNIGKIPEDTAEGTYIFLANGEDGTAPATVSDWETVQEKFVNRRIVAFMNTGTTNKDVHKNFREWMKTFSKYPEYVGAIEDFENDWQALENYGQEFMVSTSWSMFKLVYGWRYVSDPLSPVAPKRIPIIGKYLGARIFLAYNGGLHRSPADREINVTLTNDVSGGVVYEDRLEVWDNNVRTKLYNAGVNLIQFVQGIGLIMRNDRFPTNDIRVRDGHIHWINKLIEFISEDNLQNLENTPAKRQRTLFRVRNIIEEKILQPLHEGNLLPYVVSDRPGDPGSGAFVDTLEDGETPAQWNDVSRVIADISNNPKEQFDAGIARADVEYVTYSLLNRMPINVYPVTLTFISQ